MLKLCLVLVAALVAVAAALATASHLTHPHRFPARLRNTPLHRQSVREERAYSASIGHSTNTSVNWIDMPLYHTGQPGQQTFKNRYYYDTSFWKRDAQPIGNVGLFYASGEGPSTGTPGGFLLDVANMTGALIINCENRWYGESLPGKLTDTPLIMGTLKLDYVLADANFCMTYTENLLNGGKPMKWYVVGGSYSGAISSWLRARYPERLIWSWSSSGVVHPKLDHTEFDGHVVKVLPSQCYLRARRAFEQFDALWAVDNGVSVKQLLGGVPAFFTREDTAWMLSDGTAMQTQYGGKTAFCDIMDNAQYQPGGAAANSNNDMLLRLKESINKFWGPTWLTSLDSACYYSTECLSNPVYNASWGPAGRSWVMQLAIDFAWWQVGYHAQKQSLRPRYLTTEYFFKQIRAMTGNPTQFPDLFTLNAKNGGQWPYSLATKVVALQGSADPWQTVGVRESFPDKEYYSQMGWGPDVGHCHDLGSPGPNDSDSVKAVRAFIKEKARKWMGLPPDTQQQQQNKQHALGSQQHHRLVDRMMHMKKH